MQLIARFHFKRHSLVAKTTPSKQLLVKHSFSEGNIFCFSFHNRYEWASALNEFRVEASWKLGQWDELESYLIDVSFSARPSS